MRWTEDQIKYLHQNYSTMTNKKLGEELGGRSEAAIKDKAKREGLEKKENIRLIRKIKNTSTPIFEDEKMNHFISGFVAGEGTFTTSGDKKVFRIHLSSDDKKILEEIKKYLNSGVIYEQDSRDENWKDEVVYSVQSKAEIWKIIIPFFDKVGLRNTHKQKQYEEWREEVKNILPEEIT